MGSSPVPPSKKNLWADGPMVRREISYCKILITDGCIRGTFYLSFNDKIKSHGIGE